MEITGISPQKKDKLRCNIEVDGKFYCGMKLETVIVNRLKAGASSRKRNFRNCSWKAKRRLRSIKRLFISPQR